MDRRSFLFSPALAMSAGKPDTDHPCPDKELKWKNVGNHFGPCTTVPPGDPYYVEFDYMWYFYSDGTKVRVPIKKNGNQT